VSKSDHDWKLLGPAAKRRAVGMLLQVKGMSERFACKVVGVHRSTFRRLPLDQIPDDPDAGARAWLREYARKNPCHGFRRAWAALRFDEGHRVNRRRVHRLRKAEGLQVRAHHRRKRAGSSSVPAVAADAPKTVEPDVHLIVRMRGHQMHHAACVTAALVLV
jgi:transposase